MSDQMPHGTFGVGEKVFLNHRTSTLAVKIEIVINLITGISNLIIDKK